MSDKKLRNEIRKKRYTWPIIIMIILIIARLLLPYFLKRYVNNTLNDIPGYEGHVEDIDVALYRGAYVIKGLILKKKNAATNTPVLDFPENDISIEWGALMHGKVVSEIEMHNPKFNYIFEDQKKKSSEGEANTDDWTRALTSLVPFDINRLTVYNGSANFVRLSSDPEISMFLNHIQLLATNLSNIVNTQKTLPSNLHATATSMGNGKVILDGNMNLLKKIPDIDMDFSLKKADVTAINNLTKRYAGVDFEKGTFELYSEVAIADGFLKGYLKPMFINTKLLGEEDKGFFDKLWEGFVGLFKFILKNQGTDTLATKVPIEGDLNKVETELIPTVFNIFKNAWIDAFKGNVDKNINFKDAVKESKKNEE